MANDKYPVFSHGRCFKTDLYDNIIDIMVNAGWERVDFNRQDDFANEYDILSSRGEDGRSHMAIELNPYGGGFASSRSSYNIRNEISYEKMYMRLSNGYSEEEGYSFIDDRYLIISLFSGHSSESGSSYRHDHSYDAVDIEYYYYADRDGLCLITKVPEYQERPCQLILIGKPKEMFMEEVHDGMFSGIITMTSGPFYWTRYGKSTQYWLDGNVATLRTSRNRYPKDKYYHTLSTTGIIPPRTLTTDGVIQISPRYLRDDVSVGIRAEIGYFYGCRKGGLKDGDIVEITQEDGSISKFRYTELYTNMSSLPTSVDICIRVE